MNGRKKRRKEGKAWGWEEEHRPGEPLGCSGYWVYRLGRSVWWALFCFPKQFNMSTKSPFQIYTIPLPVACLFSSFLTSDQPPNLKIKAIVCSVLSSLFVSISKNNNTFPFSSPVSLLPARVLVNLIFSWQSGRRWPGPDLWILHPAATTSQVGTSAQSSLEILLYFTFLSLCEKEWDKKNRLMKYFWCYCLLLCHTFPTNLWVITVSFLENAPSL